MGLEIRGSFQPGGLPCRKVGEEDFWHSQACSAGCGMLRGGQKEVGTCRQILEEGPHRCLSVLMWHACNSSLVPGGRMDLLLAFSCPEKPCMLRVDSQSFCDSRSWALYWCSVALCVQDTSRGVLLSQDWWCQAQYHTSPHTLVPKLVFILQKTAWPRSSCTTTKILLVGGRKQMQGIYFLTHRGNASAFGLGLMFRSLTVFFRCLCNSCV